MLLLLLLLVVLLLGLEEGEEEEGEEEEEMEAREGEEEDRGGNAPSQPQRTCLCILCVQVLIRVHGSLVISSLSPLCLLSGGVFFSLLLLVLLLLLREVEGEGGEEAMVVPVMLKDEEDGEIEEGEEEGGHPTVVETRVKGRGLAAVVVPQEKRRTRPRESEGRRKGYKRQELRLLLLAIVPDGTILPGFHLCRWLGMVGSVASHLPRRRIQ